APVDKPAAAPEANPPVAEASATQGIALGQPEAVNAPAQRPVPKPAPPKPDGKGTDGKGTDGKGTGGKAEAKPARTDTKKIDTKKTDAKKSDTAAKPAADEAPAPDLAQQRALAIVEYLLQAGAGLDQVAVAGEGPPAGQRNVAFALRP
ncbi:hypothetical protein ACFQ12_25470, partial [Methylobacterium trifolii]